MEVKDIIVELDKGMRNQFLFGVEAYVSDKSGNIKSIRLTKDEVEKIKNIILKQ